MAVPFAKVYLAKFFQNGHSRKVISRNFSKIFPNFFLFLRKTIANVFYIRTKFIKIEEKKNVVKDYSRDFSKLIFLILQFFISQIFSKISHSRNFISQNFFRNCHSRKFISRNCKNSG